MEIADRLEKARLLVTQLEAGEHEAADVTLNELGSQRDSDLYQEVGRITRELHESINDFLSDQRIAEIAKREIPDARERLNYVIEMTENSANRTLQAVEESIPLTDEIKQRADQLGTQWQSFRAREMAVEQFRGLSDELEMFMSQLAEHSGTLHGNLSEVLMAQDFQDLTGQIIRQVITLVQDVEERLVQLVRITGAQLPEKQLIEEKLEGPVVPGVDQGDVVAGQDDVDDLLSSLGF